MNAQVIGRSEDGAPTENSDAGSSEPDRVQPAEDDADGGESTHPRSISKDDAFHVLQNARRRAVLRYLLEHPERERFRMRDVAEEVAAWEHDTTVQQLVSDERQRVYIALYQSHLPKLDEHGIIAYNQSRGVVETTDLTPMFAPYLEDGLHAERDLTVDESDPAGTGSSGALTRAITSFLDG